MIDLKLTVEQANMVLTSLGKAQADIGQLIQEIQKQATEQLTPAPDSQKEDEAPSE